jgi:hypothetical protein
MRVAMSAATAVLLLSGPALAEDPIATAAEHPAAPQPPAPESTTPVPLPPADAAQPVRAQPVALGPCGPEKVKPDGTLETKPHGEVEVGVGTGGYRHASAVVCQPIGQNGAVTVGVSDTQFDHPYRRR